MSAFWIAGIAINVIAFGAIVAWAVRAWRQGEAQRRHEPRDGD